VTGFTIAWNGILSFFSSVWNGIVLTVMTVANWMSGVWGVVTGAFSGAWTWVSDLFVSIWDGIKGVVLGFVEWLSPVIDAIIAPFKAIGNVIGGIINTVGGWFGETVDLGKSELAKMNEKKVVTAASKPVENASVPIVPNTQASVTAPSLNAKTTVVAAPPLDATTVMPAPSPGATTNAMPVPAIGGDMQMSAGTSATGGNGLLSEHLAAASRKGIAASELTATASDAFMSAGASISPSSNYAELTAEAQESFQEAMPRQSASFETPWKQSESRNEKGSPRTIKIENLYLQADDCLDLLNFVRQLEQAVLVPEEVAA
jgi:hypothetical protein